MENTIMGTEIGTEIGRYLIKENFSKNISEIYIAEVSPSKKFVLVNGKWVERESIIFLEKLNDVEEEENY